MSRVTINALANDLSNLYMSITEDSKKIRAVRGVEVVPRRMVEMIINECTNIIDVYAGNSNYDCGRSCTAVDIKTLAESLLKQFEEDE